MCAQANTFQASLPGREARRRTSEFCHGSTHLLGFGETASFGAGLVAIVGGGRRAPFSIPAACSLLEWVVAPGTVRGAGCNLVFCCKE